MNFSHSLAKYRRLYEENKVWKLLRATTAPLILAFIEQVFSSGQNEISYSQARILLDAELEKNHWYADTPAAIYINQWVKDGWLREMDNKLTKTDTCEIALRFCQSFDERNINTSASHLRIVQEAVRELVIALNENPEERIALLNQRKAELEKEITIIQTRGINTLSDQQRRERLREIYQLASVLTNDFRYVEDEIRRLDQEIRIKMIEKDNNRGEVLQATMDQEALLAQSDAGSAFESFFQLLCDSNRSTEFKEQLDIILNQISDNYLQPRQRKFLKRLLQELTQESEHIFQIRRRTEENLKTYIKSGAAQEKRTVDRLIIQLEQLAVNFSKNNINLKQATNLILPTGNIEINSPDSICLKEPIAAIQITDITEHTNSVVPSETVLTLLDTIQIKEVADSIYHNLCTFGPLTIAGLVEKKPINFGLEELVAYLRIAQHIQATDLNEKESIIIQDKQGIQIKATLPKYLLSASLFPDNLEELSL
ncbi:hypothetical protein SALWKB2_1745 [Snodgrassella alvi wkB2]|uniref:DUF3375 domain-containing protein n=1 Tax=Snodgrassella alvi TaxID=1196083 RepID=A0ABD7Z129_9NEIS|nr:DUF3375 domain-containing protein [Snodgrassella alvi]AHN29127.1 hypothetical protein SALWKB2_1745 [Snodgrassella alvi wkB2]PIT44386.1 hypothetical protein BHC45_05720 [Snodgrassella alvi]UOO97845.1 DUF3375 domain-containing protein [Snodgrassella alvi wkB2]WLS98211.1 DUF3375 domain-containing protein [Snodgrassella alvi]